MVVAVIVENTGAGGDFAAPIARELIRVALEAPP
jgi:cell division protein FtsI/penicillin-binding protein 2